MPDAMPLVADPFAKFQDWMNEAWTHEPEDANAMTLASATPDDTNDPPTYNGGTVYSAGDCVQTNVDLVAARIGQTAGANDLIVITPWYNAISFERYYHGPATRMTTRTGEGLGCSSLSAGSTGSCIGSISVYARLVRVRRRRIGQIGGSSGAKS